MKRPLSALKKAALLTWARDVIATSPESNDLADRQRLWSAFFIVIHYG